MIFCSGARDGVTMSLAGRYGVFHRISLMGHGWRCKKVAFKRVTNLQSRVSKEHILFSHQLKEESWQRAYRIHSKT